MTYDTNLISALKAKANLLRIHSIESTTAAGSGHPTTCLSAAEIMATLFFHVMKWDPKNPKNQHADRFVLSKGHAAPVLYAAWVEAGVITKEENLTLRKIDSPLEGHPTPRLPFVDVATGSLGQGLGAGVGLALGSRDLDKTDSRVYVLLGDGEIAEGSVWEAAQMAGNYDLQNIVAIVDANRLGQSQATAVGHNDSVYVKRFEAFGWDAVEVDGHNVEELLAAFDKAEASKDKPFAIIAKTFKGKGVSFAEDKDNWHGKAFNKEQAAEAIKEIEAAGITSDYKLEIPAPSSAPLPAVEVSTFAAPDYKIGDEIATREAYGVALTKLGAANSSVVALDADTKNSTYSDKFLKAYPNRFFECFIAEQNMISVAAGLAGREKIPYASSFAVFLSRGFDQVRMAGVGQNNIKLVGSHVGVSIGEDGPSQMGLEDLSLYRSIPNAVVFYPSDAVSAERAIELSAEYKGVVYVRTSRPKTPVVYENNEKFEIGKAKVIRKSTDDKLTIVAAGITLAESVKAANKLAAEGINVRIIDPFTIKPLDGETIIKNAKETGSIVLTVEDHYHEGGIGEAVAAALALTDIKVYCIAVEGIPHSGPPEALLAKFGIDSTSILKKIKEIL